MNFVVFAKYVILYSLYMYCNFHSQLTVMCTVLAEPSAKKPSAKKPSAKTPERRRT